jgi:acetylornithine deacetylase/succinyl-diaminopimelate desuccinylase-like protein
MRDPDTGLTSIAREIVSLDSASCVSNLPTADQIESALAGFDTERLDDTDSARVVRCALAAHRGNGSGLALSGHMDRVPDPRRMAA